MKLVSDLKLAFLSCLLLSSCATVFGGKVSDCQRTRPLPGQPARKIRVVALVADAVTFPPWVFVDFATGAIYRPCK